MFVLMKQFVLLKIMQEEYILLIVLCASFFILFIVFKLVSQQQYIFGLLLLTDIKRVQLPLNRNMHALCMLYIVHFLIIRTIEGTKNPNTLQFRLVRVLCIDKTNQFYCDNNIDRVGIILAQLYLLNCVFYFSILYQFFIVLYLQLLIFLFVNRKNWPDFSLNENILQCLDFIDCVDIHCMIILVLAILKLFQNIMYFKIQTIAQFIVYFLSHIHVHYIECPNQYIVTSFVFIFLHNTKKNPNFYYFY
eukprot:TRINITY_DN3894_c0_g2_i2.p2 TRINITY_DN3894_c0_g2~~TRINITY_DN3894_c0_g2_i2.p2  ORF type:complete len:258 (-),score=-27.91 TRINITY_DN3894_c0_g2_i2:1074-1817(-)